MSKRKSHLQKTNPKDQEKLNEEEEFSPEIAELIHDLPKEKRQVIIQALVKRTSFSGPLPDGESIRIYNEVIPNGGERLMATVEKQLVHRFDIEKVGVKRTFNQSSTGQWMGFAIAIVFGLIAWDLGKAGKETTASIIGAFDIVGLVAIFVIGQFKNK
jgi:uncharacterized membrane protein